MASIRANVEVSCFDTCVLNLAVVGLVLLILFETISILKHCNVTAGAKFLRVSAFRLRRIPRAFY